VADVGDLTFLRDGELDLVFSSNFLEHLPDKKTLTRTMQGVRRVLKPGGRVILMGPNIRLVPGAYWDFYDHEVPLTDVSVCELLALTGFRVVSRTARFLPYTTRSALPQWPWLVRAYLALRPLSSALLGRQFLVVAEAPKQTTRP
jgi:SAM-dependent methyltransferase